MPAMSRFESAFCRGAAWRLFTRRVVLPWVLDRDLLEGELLEVGSGSGEMAVALLERFPALRLTATDHDTDMVETARRRLGRFGDRVRIEQASVTDLPFPDERFEAAVSFLMLHHVGNWQAALGELVRVVRPGGRLYVYDLLDGPPARLIHRVTRSPGVNLIDEPALGELLPQLPLARARVRNVRGVLFRLHAQKQR